MTLNSKQERAIYLLTAGISPITVVQELEITNDILQGWLQHPEFIQALNTHKQVCREANRNRLEYLFGRALNALDEVLKTGTAAEKLQAVQLLMDKFDLTPAVAKSETSVSAPLPVTAAAPETAGEQQAASATPQTVTANVAEEDDAPQFINPMQPVEENLPFEHEVLSEVDETILEECLDDLQFYINGDMILEKAKVRLSPIINPAHLTQANAAKLLPAVIKQVNANQVNHIFTVKT